MVYCIKRSSGCQRGVQGGKEKLRMTKGWSRMTNRGLRMIKEPVCENEIELQLVEMCFVI